MRAFDRRMMHRALDYAIDRQARARDTEKEDLTVDDIRELVRSANSGKRFWGLSIDDVAKFRAAGDKLGIPVRVEPDGTIGRYTAPGFIPTRYCCVIGVVGQG